MVYRDGVSQSTSKLEPEESEMCSKMWHNGDQKMQEGWKEEHICDGLGCSGAKVRGVGQQAFYYRLYLAACYARPKTPW